MQLQARVAPLKDLCALLLAILFSTSPALKPGLHIVKSSTQAYIVVADTEMT